MDIWRLTSISPINAEQRTLVCDRTRACLHQASDRFSYDFQQIPILFDLKGTAAGMFRLKGRERQIRYNPYLFAKYFDENLATTVPHEVAHYVVDVLYDRKQIKPHGQEWKQIMALFAADDSATCKFDLQDVPRRHYRYFDYACSCRHHNLTAIRHNRIKRGMRYHCRSCKQILLPC